jgi:hypothetical protein
MQNDLAINDYYGLMMDNIDEVTNKRLIALGEIEKTRSWSPKLTMGKTRCLRERQDHGHQSLHVANIARLRLA